MKKKIAVAIASLSLLGAAPVVEHHQAPPAQHQTARSSWSKQAMVIVPKSDRSSWS